VVANMPSRTDALEQAEEEDMVGIHTIVEENVDRQL
jgi:hypothetical protein